MDKIVVVIAAALLIGFIAWWFFGKRETSSLEATVRSDAQEVEVVVSGGYAPNTVVLQQGLPARVVFKRTDPSGCFNEVVFPELGIREELPVGERFPIAIDTAQPGEYQYSCGMNMFHGKVVVR